MKDFTNKILCGQVETILKTMPDAYVDTIITSPPYWGLRDYGAAGQIGLEPTLKEYIESLLLITSELKRVLKPTGVMFWNHGDCYGGSPAGNTGKSANAWQRPSRTAAWKAGKLNIKKYDKCLMLQNYRLILRMIDEQGWILRNDIKWHKANPMPSSVKDRFTNTYEPVFMLTKNTKYWFDLESVRKPYIFNRWGGRHKTNEDVKAKPGDKRAGGQGALNRMNYDCYLHSGKNPGDLWTIPTQPFPGAHFATFPEKLIEPMIKASCPEWICRKCSKPRERIVKTEYVPHRKAKNLTNPRQNSSYIASQGKVCNKTHQTTGWTDCGCQAGWRPGISLDPFIGNGTVAIVAKRLGRHWIGIDLNPDYVKMAENRTVNTMGRLL